MAPPLIVFRDAREAARTAAGPAALAPCAADDPAERPFRLVMGLYLLSWTTASILAAVLVYYASYRLRIPEQANYFVLVAQGMAIAFIPLTVWLARRLDKRRAFILGSLSWVVVLLGISALGPGQVALAYVLAALSGFGIATAYVIPWAMVPDVIEVDEAETGQRRDRLLLRARLLLPEARDGAALWAMGQALAWTGYLTPTAAQPAPCRARRWSPPYASSPARSPRSCWRSRSHSPGAIPSRERHAALLRQIDRSDRP